MWGKNSDSIAQSRHVEINRFRGVTILCRCIFHINVCASVSMARDLKILQNYYQIEKTDWIGCDNKDEAIDK